MLPVALRRSLRECPIRLDVEAHWVNGVAVLNPLNSLLTCVRKWGEVAIENTGSFEPTVGFVGKCPCGVQVQAH